MNNMMNNMNQMGMNNFPINQMGMNQMGMNPMMMNNQQNFIQYENKIRELEEIIKQKDFEIIALKQKLNNISNPNVINMNPMMTGINQNQMNMNMENLFQNIKRELDEISINIKSENDEFVVKIFEDDKVSILREKYNLKKALTYNYKPLDENLTFKEIGIYHGSTIQEKNHIYTINFQYNGKTIKVCLTEDCPLRMAIIYYLIKINREVLILQFFDGKLEFFFIYNGAKLKINNNTPIKDIFDMSLNPLVKVFESKNIIG
jgi:hypothetical protein